MLALYALIEPEDHVISMYPTYQQLYDIPKSLGADVDLWKLKRTRGGCLIGPTPPSHSS